MTPILYSFRRCPYAIRARLALAASGVAVELREILLRDKPAAFLAASPSGTVPCLVTDAGVIDESLDIMLWALRQSDPEGWLDMPDAGRDWIAPNDGPFKHALDRVKYASRYPDDDAGAHLDAACTHLAALEDALGDWLFTRPSLADYAMLPFVRQFAFIDKPWFDTQPWPRVQAWLDRFLTSDRFAAVMAKHPVWAEGDAPRLFPQAAAPPI
ncbi:glutathione S-transferase [Roseibaca sp. Y0-43]|uniref:glutathione S-transferase n=1 Tax=Roseibaca sp. Y0-43 TaxID=2816854 RepID=UPI001D0CA470|nr:glutathione S-transferase [Roseibaca sp. Y0-43]MCC1482550.1 glutathione S-transferase [Roseibaca sp. Y0-43]